MFTTKFGPFNGSTWEDLCQQVFKRKYQTECYQQMPASPGDYGIEGYTVSTGWAFQCYCPEKHYERTELYEKQRDKITEDLAKLRDYQKDLQARLGSTKLSRWVFVTPEIDRNVLLRHAKTREAEVRGWNLPFLTDDFTVLLHDGDHYVVEINEIRATRGEAPVVEVPAVWKCAEQSKASATRLIRLDNVSGEEDQCPRLTGPNLQLSIRPRRRNPMKVGGLVERFEQLQLELPLFGQDISARLARNEYGVCRYVVNMPEPVRSSLRRKIVGVLPGRWITEPKPNYEAFTQIYPDGEMWLVDCASLQYPMDEEVRPIVPDIEARFVSAMDRARAVLRRFGMEEPYEVVAIILGIGDRVLPLMDERGELTGNYTPQTDEIEIKRELSVENESDTSLNCLMPLFDALWESVHSKRPDYYNRIAVQKARDEQARRLA